MHWLIDGYNLLHATAVTGRRGRTALEKARRGLLNLIASAVGDEAAQTTVVFDAVHAPLGLPAETRHRGLRVVFARPGGDADVVLAQLIAESTAPRRLTVVSSDHQVQRAARRRRAAVLDSQDFLTRVVRRPTTPPSSLVEPPAKTGDAPVDADYWMRQFAITPSEDLPLPLALRGVRPLSSQAKSGQRTQRSRRTTTSRRRRTHEH